MGIEQKNFFEDIERQYLLDQIYLKEEEIQFWEDMNNIENVTLEFEKLPIKNEYFTFKQIINELQ